MTQTVSRIDDLESREIVRDQLCLSGGASESSILAEIVRSSIWAHQPRNVESLQPVHRHRIVATGVSSAAWLLKVDANVARDLLSRTIDELVALGELDRADNGYFLPTPVRWVDIPGKDRKLLVGGVPTRVLPPTIRAGVRQRHFVREGDGDEILVTQSLDSWISRPRSELNEWFETVLQKAKGNARAADFPELAQAECQLYPTRQDDFQFYRWESVASIQSIPQGVFLTRIRNAFSISSWGLLWSDARGCSLSEISPQEVDVRRVRYAFDQHYGWPTTTTIRRGSSRDELVCKNELPKAEQRFLNAISEKVNNQGSTFYPRRWILPKGYEEPVKDILTALGIGLRYEVSR